jgi:hypothetical protein
MNSARALGLLTIAGGLVSVASAAQPWVPVAQGHACDRACAVATLERAMFGALPTDQRLAIAAGMIRAGRADEAYERVGHLVSPETYEAMRPEWKSAMDKLARGEGNGVAACFAPGTPEEVVQAFDQLMFDAGNRFQEATRWSRTALSGSGLSQGDPTIITYSYVPDGTFINDAGFGGGPSDLFAWLNGIYGSPAVWQSLMDDVFDDWEALSGNTYVYEPNDDGANHSSSANRGIAGVRGDVRIGAKRIDGGGGVLAYNFFPDNGDMVLDSDDSFYNNTGGNSLRLRNIVSHEHGHGKGMAHVCPANGTKLMEPFINLGFDGPQLDDRLHAQRLYGDINEPNDNASVATNLGSPQFLSLSQLSIDDNSDSDWYAVVFNDPGELTVQVTPTGQTYLDGPQNSNGSCSAGTPYDSLRIHDLGVDIVDSNGFTIVATADNGGLGDAENLTWVAESAGTYYIRVTGDTTNSIQAYNMFVTIEELPFIPATIQIVGAAPDLLDPGVATPLQVTIDPNDEVVSNRVLKFRADGGSFQTIPLQASGGQIFTVDLPAVDCGNNPEFYFEITGDQSGTITLPAGGAASPFAALVGELDIAFEDNFETNQGWTIAGNINSANSGRWERGTPAGGGDERVADPGEDADGSGQCYVTGNVAGNSDVDGGNTQLISPNFQVAGSPEAVLTYSRWFDNNEAGGAANPFQEIFVVEISNNGGGSWQVLEIVGPNGPEVSGGWFEKSFRIADFVTPTDQVRVRFTAKDDVGTVVEAGVDAVRVEGLTCEDPVGGPCNAADLAAPEGVLDLADINAFVAGFTAQDPISDLVAPFGVFDLADINAFVSAFSAGCP